METFICFHVAGWVTKLDSWFPVLGRQPGPLGFRVQVESSSFLPHHVCHLLLLFKPFHGLAQRPAGELRRAGCLLTNWHHHRLTGRSEVFHRVPSLIMGYFGWFWIFSPHPPHHLSSLSWSFRPEETTLHLGGDTHPSSSPRNLAVSLQLLLCCPLSSALLGKI